MKYRCWLFFAVVFTLPMYMRLNNGLLLIFILVSLFDIIFISKKISLKNLLVNGWPIVGFFMLSAMAAFHNGDVNNFRYLETHWSLLFVPLVMLSEKNFYAKIRRTTFISLVWGCLAALAICYLNLIMKIISEGESLQNWFAWHHMGHDFTFITDAHPTYLGLFVVTSILFLIQDKKFPQVSKYILLIIFLFGLFQLASKMAILLLVLFFLYLAINNIRQYKQQLILLIFGILFSAFVFWTFGNQYMKSRMFSVDEILDEKRIDRWEVSYQIFKENPFYGAGFEKIKGIRKEKYLHGDYSLAAANDLNAHNQFLEYLSVNGAVGGFVYAISLGFLFLLSIYRRDHLFTFIFFAFALANLTESMMVRIMGVEYFAIFASLFLCSKGSDCANNRQSIRRDDIMLSAKKMDKI